MNNYIDINDIYVKHWILFPYETKHAIGFINPHHCFAVKDSIHYKCIANKEYQPYVSMITTTSQREHSLDKFLDLEDKINNEFLCKNKITVNWCNILNKWCVTDGCHRLAILLKQNITSIKKEWIII